MVEKNNMKISVSNYGPIAEAKNIELCPLTVFVGPSNTGKSYLAVLIYSLFRSFKNRRMSRFFYNKRRKQEQVNTSLNINSKLREDVRKWLKNLDKEEVGSYTSSALPEGIRKWANKLIAEVVSYNFHQEISRCLGGGQKESPIIGDNFHIDLEDDKKSLNLRSPNTISSLNIELKKLSLNLRDYVRIRRWLFTEETPLRKSDVFFFSEFLDVLSRNVFASFRKVRAFYLPAARTGIMQSHLAITGALVQRSTFAGLEPVSVPTLSGIVSDFLERIILMDTDEVYDSNMEKIADEMEKEILHGFIKVKISEAVQYPQFLYKQNGLEIPLLRSSSMVSELAPIILFIRHKIRKDDLLIIEEPEAHLHPEAQRGIAKAVVHLVRAGIRVMVTTHSDYFLDQLANYIRFSKLTEAKPDEVSKSQTLFLKEEEVGAYVFNQNRGGTIVSRLKFDKENGLCPEDHNKVSSELYNETVDALDAIDKLDNRS